MLDLASHRTKVSGAGAYRLGSLVATFVAQGGLIGPGEVTVPCQKVTLARLLESENRSRARQLSWDSYSSVDAQGLVDMNGNKVVISGAGARGKCRVGLGGLLCQAENSINIILLLIG
jgi:hypothetical protein